jgi:DNA polymerase-1
VVDYLALVGDSSDNVPGVKGIGEKGARKLLLDYGDLDAILAHAAEVTAKRTREALLAQADNARLSRELVTIKRDVPIELDVARLTLQEPDQEAAVRILTELEFFSLARKLAGGAGEGVAPESELAAPAAPEPADGAETTAAGSPETFTAADWLALDTAPALAVTVVDDPAEIPSLVERLRTAPLVALDTEASSTEPRDAELVGLSLAASPSEVWYLPFGHRPAGGELAVPAPVRNLPPLGDPALAPLRSLLADRLVPKAGHNIKYDWQVLRGAGVELGGVVYDSMLASFVLDPGRRSHAIDNLCLEHLGRAMKTYADVAGRGRAEIAFA